MRKSYHILHICSLLQCHVVDMNIFDHMTFTMTFDLYLKILNADL